MPKPDPSSIRAVILDMDGVLWRANQPIGSLPAVFDHMRSLGWRIILATNNATRTPTQYIDRLRSFGVEGLEPWQVINSAMAAAHYLKSRFPEGGPVYISGEQALVEILAAEGFYPAEEKVLAVVASMDRQFSYEKLRRATMLIRSGAPLLATNTDRTFPTPEGEGPGAGSLVISIETASEVKAIVAGKPSPEMYRVALERLGVTAVQTLAVGDRLETDIAGAQALGCPTGLVLSGVSTQEEALAWDPPVDWIADDLTALVNLLAGSASKMHD